MNLRVIRRRGEQNLDGTAHDAAPADAGFSLVEIVITIVLIGIVVIPMLVASASSITASSRTREAAETETVLQNAADRLNRAPVQCNYDPYVQAALKAKGWDPALVTASYEFYQPGSTVLAGTPGSWSPGGCPGGSRPAMLIQRVTITVDSPSHKIHQTIRVIKNDV